MMKNLVLMAALVGALLVANGAQAADALILNTGTRAPYTTDDKKGFLDQVITEAFKRAGARAEVLVYDASARAMEQANAGIDAGFAMRVKGLEKRFTNMLMVPETIISNDFVALSKGQTVETKDWNTLDQFDIAYILGWKVFERNLGHHKGVIKPRNADQLVDLLRLDRVDFILYERWQGAWRAKNQGLKVTVHEPPLAAVPMYIYLHKSHAALVDKVSAALKGMKADGSYQRIVDTTLTSLITDK